MQGKRYKFNGSSFQIQSGVSAAAAQAITGISKANPAVIQATGSNYGDGTVLLAAAVLGMVEINGQLLVADNGTANTFEAANIDSTGYSAYVSGGTLKAVTFTDFCELTGANQQDGAADQTEVTTICSTAKEFEQGLSDSGTIQLDYNFAPSVPMQTLLRQAKRSGAQIAFKVSFGANGAGGIAIMFGTVQQSSFTGKVNGVWTGQTTVRLTGDINLLAAA